MTTNIRIIIFAPLLLLSSCCVQDRDETINPGQVLTSYSRELDPENVILKLKNGGDSNLCVSISETQLGSGYIKLSPKESMDYGENRPPPILVGGLDVSDGIYIIPRKSSRDLFVKISNIDQRVPRPQTLYGEVRFVGCRSLFEGYANAVTEKFSVSL